MASRPSSAAQSVSTSAGPGPSAESMCRKQRQREILVSLGFEANGSEVSVSRLGAATSRDRPTWWRRSRGSTATTRFRPLRLARAPGIATPTATRTQLIERRLRRAAAARGLDEAVTWSFISEARGQRVRRRRLASANPISEEMKVMRPSLLPGLISAARRNLDRGAPSVRLFEIGRRYLVGRGASDARLHSCRRAANSQLAVAARPSFDLSTRRPRPWPCSTQQARRSTICRSSPTQDRLGIPAARRTRPRPKDYPRGLRRTSPQLDQEPRCACAVRRRLKSISMRSRPPRSSGARPRRLRAAGAAAGHPRLRIHRPCRVHRRQPAPRHPRRRQSGDHRRPALRPLRSSRRPLALRSKSRFSRSRRASPTNRSREISQRIVAAAEKLGARLRS